MFGLGRQDREGAIRCILVVEDDALIAFDNEYGLEDAGFTVVDTVDTAAEAIRLIEGGGIDLVLSDITLRGDGDGLDVARAAKAAGIPLLFVSGQCPVEAQEVSAGCLAKPYSPRDLISAIRAVEAKVAGRKTGRLPRGLRLYP